MSRASEKEWTSFRSCSPFLSDLERRKKRSYSETKSRESSETTKLLAWSNQLRTRFDREVDEEEVEEEVEADV